MTHASDYFRTARERYRIKLARDLSWPRGLWTQDPVFKAWRFCNVHREDDKTTVWFREQVRKHTVGLTTLHATLAFRWFNRIEVGELIQDLLIRDWSTDEARRRLQNVRPIVTGAYIILGEQGYPKLEGVLRCIDTAHRVAEQIYRDEAWGSSLEHAWTRLHSEIPYLGPFMAYEVVSDLRWTYNFRHVEDHLTWANAGPGCARGLGWTVANDSSHFHVGSRTGQKAMLDVMRTLLEMSRNDLFWPQDWPKWEMREVEHWSCEYDKYRRAARGDRMKRKFA